MRIYGAFFAMKFSDIYTLRHSVDYIRLCYTYIRFHSMVCSRQLLSFICLSLTNKLIDGRISPSVNDSRVC